MSLQPLSHVDTVVVDTPHAHGPVADGGPSEVHAPVLPSPEAGVSADHADGGDQAQAEVLQPLPPGPLSGQVALAGAVHKVGSENNESFNTSYFTFDVDCGL